MRILIHDRSGYAFPLQLSRSLAQRGHEVLHVYAPFFQAPQGPLQKREQDPATLSIEGVDLLEPFQKYSFVKRHRQEIEYGRLLARRAVGFVPDLVISADAPPDAQRILLNACQKSKIKFIFWVQDIYGVAISRILRKRLSLLGLAVGRYYESMERRLLERSDSVVLITQDFAPLYRTGRRLTRSPAFRRIMPGPERMASRANSA